MQKFGALLIFYTIAFSALAASKPVEVTVDQLVRTPKQFNGKRVSVTGYFDTTVHHGCDLRAHKRRPDELRQYINVVVPEGSVSLLEVFDQSATNQTRTDTA